MHGRRATLNPNAASREGLLLGDYSQLCEGSSSYKHHMIFSTVDGKSSSSCFLMENSLFIRGHYWIISLVAMTCSSITAENEQICLSLINHTCPTSLLPAYLSPPTPFQASNPRLEDIEGGLSPTTSSYRPQQYRKQRVCR